MLTPTVVELNRLCAHRAPELRHARPATTAPAHGQQRAFTSPAATAPATAR